MASQVGEEVQATSAVSKAVAKIKTKSIKGTVTDSQGRILVGATVYFVDSSTVDFSTITNANMRDNSAEAFDEPLEDIIRDPVKAAALPQAVTDSKGRFKAKLPVVRHFAYVEPNNSDYLPGGSASRDAFLPTTLPKKTGLAIKVSWIFPDDATYIGPTRCLNCHDGGAGPDKRGWGSHAHALQFTVGSGPSAIQDFSKHEGWDTLAKKFLAATSADYRTKGTKLLLCNYVYVSNGNSGNSFEIFENGTQPTSAVVSMHAYLWKDTGDGNKLKFTIEGTDTSNPQTYPVAGFMGGGTLVRLCC